MGAREGEQSMRSAAVGGAMQFVFQGPSNARVKSSNRMVWREDASMQWPLLLLGVMTRSAEGFLWGHVEDTHVYTAWNDKFTYEGELQTLREERSLVYPNGGICKFIIGLGIPVPLPNKTIGLGVNFQFQYPVPSKPEQLFPPIPLKGRRIRYSRAALYSSAEKALERSGLPGRACLLRAVCEAAETPLLHEGLLGEVLHLLLTPSLGHAPWELLAEYRAAEEAGAAGEDCAQRFAACPPGAGLLDSISYLRSMEEDEDPDLWRRPPPHWQTLFP